MIVKLTLTMVFNQPMRVEVKRLPTRRDVIEVIDPLESTNYAVMFIGGEEPEPVIKVKMTNRKPTMKAKAL